MSQQQAETAGTAQGFELPADLEAEVRALFEKCGVPFYFIGDCNTRDKKERFNVVAYTSPEGLQKIIVNTSGAHRCLSQQYGTEAVRHGIIKQTALDTCDMYYFQSASLQLAEFDLTILAPEPQDYLIPAETKEPGT